MKRSTIAASAAALYLAVGAYFGWALCTAMPAVNWMGGAYVALTWPTWLKVSPVKLPIPAWMFSFDNQDHG